MDSNVSVVEFGRQDKHGRQELEQLRERVKMLEAVIENFPGGIVLTDKNLQVVLCNHQQKQLLQYPASLFEDGNPSLRELFHFNAARGEYGPGEVNDLVHQKMELVRKREPHIFERVRPNGRVIEIRGVPLPGGGFVTSYTDVTENRLQQAVIAEQALTDSLTGLSNRLHFEDRLAHAFAFAKRGEDFAVHLIDLDDFKPINDKHGHEAGDIVIREIATRFKNLVRETDTIARMGGDEFVVIQSKVDTVEAANHLAARLAAAVRLPVNFGGKTFTVAASIGFSLSKFAPLEPRQILKQADIAMYDSKRLGKGKISVFKNNEAPGSAQ
jgi:diguanylate cyclase (GGDEF)-like protein